MRELSEIVGRRFTPSETNSSGYILDSDTPAAAVGAADVIRLGIIPAGVRISDALVLISDASTANITFKLGFAYVDGVDVTAVPQDDDYFIIAGRRRRYCTVGGQ